MAKANASEHTIPMPTAARPCPICGKPAGARHKPFCSGRCANIDLGRWLKGNYSIETEEAPPDAAEPDDE
jgi:uncharacterized protein